MRNNKMLILTLLDLCAFAVTQVPEENIKDAQEDFDFACKLAEDNGLVDLESYKKLASTYRRGGPGPINN